MEDATKVANDIQKWRDNAHEWNQTAQDAAALLERALPILRDYPKVVERANREAKGRVRVHIALGEAIGGDAASKINDDPIEEPTGAPV